MRRPLALGALLAAFLALHALYNLSIPLGEGPDEPGHLAYVFFLAREGRLPTQRAAPQPSDVPGEGHQPPLAYLLAAPSALILPPAERQVTLSANPRFLWTGGDEPAAFRRGSRERWPWQGIAPAWHLARAISGLCGAATLVFTYLAARRLRPADPAFALLATALLAFNPQFLFVTALVTNDALLAALGAAVLWGCLGPDGIAPPRQRGRAEGRTPLWPDNSTSTAPHPHASTLPHLPGGAGYGAALGLGGVFGLALLTKQSALLLGPVLLWVSWRVAGGDLRRMTGHCLGWGLSALLVAGWWFGRNWGLYGDPLGLAVFSAEFATQPFAWHEPAAWGQAWVQLFSSYWARFGWMSLAPPAWTIWLYGALCALAVAGWFVGRPGDQETGRQAAGRFGLWAGPLILLGMGLIWTVSFALTAGLVAWQGRLLFPAAAAVALLLAEGLCRLAHLGARAGAPSSAGARRAPLLVPLALCIGAIGMPLAVIAPAYHWEVLDPDVALARLGTPTYARYAQSWEHGVELRGWRLDALAQSGATLPVTLTWHSLEPVPRPWTVFVHLVDPAGTIVAQSNLQPRSGALPFPNWTPGDWVDDTHMLELPAGLPPGAYQLRVGLYRPEKDGARQGVWALDGELIGDLAEVGTINVVEP